MSIKRILRKILLSLVLGGGRFLGTQMNREQIEELLYSANQPRAEAVISEEEYKSDSK